MLGSSPPNELVENIDAKRKRISLKRIVCVCVKSIHITSTSSKPQHELSTLIPLTLIKRQFISDVKLFSASAFAFKVNFMEEKSDGHATRKGILFAQQKRLFVCFVAVFVSILFTLVRATRLNYFIIHYLNKRTNRNRRCLAVCCVLYLLLLQPLYFCSFIFTLATITLLLWWTNVCLPFFGNPRITFTAAVNRSSMTLCALSIDTAIVTACLRRLCCHGN